MEDHRNHLYEGMYVISAKLSEDARQKALDKVIQGITHHGGEVHKIHDQGRRRLAYEIDGYREGHYYVIYFSVPPAAISELWKENHLHEDLIRFMTLRADTVLEEITFQPLVEVNL